MRHVDDRTAVLPAGQQAGAVQFLQVERQRGCRDLHPFGDAAGGQAGRARLHQQPEHGQADRMGERGKRDKGVIGFHVSTIFE
ncbi:hypothetical protein CBM2605_B50023 [Cupriavidus neocaledonicus]|uniref:Uncharacterized protein n=1 Tax=Cupriavidus neocaledonicus TaxID=1040979 RepID=A0ABY1VE03_9BURK|nr:hypothetical protein CBM2605_B50023 [Cupriavidus neocaledonicus]